MPSSLEDQVGSSFGNLLISAEALRQPLKPGTIPAELGRLSNLTDLKVGMYDLSGCVPCINWVDAGESISSVPWRMTRPSLFEAPHHLPGISDLGL